jgi:hypothetical protein
MESKPTSLNAGSNDRAMKLNGLSLEDRLLLLLLKTQKVTAKSPHSTYWTLCGMCLTIVCTTAAGAIASKAGASDLGSTITAFVVFFAGIAIDVERETKVDNRITDREIAKLEAIASQESHVDAVHWKEAP